MSSCLSKSPLLALDGSLVLNRHVEKSRYRLDDALLGSEIDHDTCVYTSLFEA
jgi:hypothetical protein